MFRSESLANSRAKLKPPNSKRNMVPIPLPYSQMQSDPAKVLVVDDLIATGGSASAAGALIEKSGGILLGYLFIVELTFLKGRDKLNAPVYTLLESQSE